MCSCHYPRMLCHVFWSQVEYKIVCFILENLLKDLKGFKLIERLEVTFEKDTIVSKTGKRVSIYKTAFFNGKAETITKPNDIEPRTKHV